MARVRWPFALAGALWALTLLGLGYAAVVLGLGRPLPEGSTLVVAVATLSAELVTLVDQTMQPTQASLWLRPRQKEEA